ncbi:HPF/RaiA family ribosome-associated protein [Egicoccus sp. AB-alg6-2]|uniref:HPF/RaiA family ribosome-associated protein n=1 Tax=Egicoccus sp. AB-alg6-2 TaxID=3242692 RepID=UPI00359E43C9
MTTVADRLRIVPEFTSEDRGRLVDILSGKLDRRFKRWDPQQVELEISAKGRDTDQQRVVLECWISGLPKLVATSAEARLDDAIAEVRDDLFRQIDKHVTKQEGSRRR